MKHSFSHIRNIILSVIFVLSVFSFAGGAAFAADNATTVTSPSGSENETVTIYVPTTRTATVTDYLTSTVTKTKTYTTTESLFDSFDISNYSWWILVIICAGIVIGLILIILILKR